MRIIERSTAKEKKNHKYAYGCLTANLRPQVDWSVTVHAQLSEAMSAAVEEKFQEYQLVPDVLRVAPTEKAEVSIVCP